MIPRVLRRPAAGARSLRPHDRDRRPSRVAPRLPRRGRARGPPDQPRVGPRGHAAGADLRVGRERGRHHVALDLGLHRRPVPLVLRRRRDHRDHRRARSRSRSTTSRPVVLGSATRRTSRPATGSTWTVDELRPQAGRGPGAGAARRCGTPSTGSGAACTGCADACGRRRSAQSTACTPFAGVILVDRRGWILLQERDEFPRHRPGEVGPGRRPRRRRRGRRAGRPPRAARGDRRPAAARRRCGCGARSRSSTRPTARTTRMHVYAAATDADRRRHRRAARDARSSSSSRRSPARSTSPPPPSIVVPAFLDSDLYASMAAMTSPQLTVIPVPGLGAEDVVVATHGPDEGAVFTGTEDGAIWRVSPDGAKVDRVADTGGRPLGIEIDLDGRLLVCDAHRGRAAGRHRAPAASRRRGQRRRAPDDVLQQRRHRRRRDGLVLRLLEALRHRALEGRLRPGHPHRSAAAARPRRHDPRSSSRGSAFANGVALAADESYVAVAESGARTVVRHWLTGDRAGTRDYLVRTCRATPTTSPAAATG